MSTVTRSRALRRAWTHGLVRRPAGGCRRGRSGTVNLGLWTGLHFEAGWWSWFKEQPVRLYGGALGLFLVALAVHYGVRHLAARSLVGAATRLGKELGVRGHLANAFLRNTKPWRSIFNRTPAGWSRRARRNIATVLESTDNYIQELNDRFTNPSGAAPLSFESEVTAAPPTEPRSSAAPQADDADTPPVTPTTTH